VAPIPVWIHETRAAFIATLVDASDHQSIHPMTCRSGAYKSRTSLALFEREQQTVIQSLRRCSASVKYTSR
jgi:hypothetical protein